jgi:hypothetical protein
MLLYLQLDKLDKGTKIMLNMLHETCVGQTGVQESEYLLDSAVWIRLVVIGDVKCKFCGEIPTFKNVTWILSIFSGYLDIHNDIPEGGILHSHQRGNLKSNKKEV